MAAPKLIRTNTRLPGGFDTDDDLSPVKMHFDDTSTELYEPAMEQPAARESSSVLDAPMESSNIPDAHSEDEESQMDILDEEAVTRQLMDFSISDELFDMSNGRNGDPPLPHTPQRASPNSLKSPTSTVIAQHVKDVEVPATVARGYRGLHSTTLSDRRNAGEDMTLKEQSNIIDRLIKENWDLKLKITFLDAALAQRSDESVKTMIAENVELKTYKFKSTKETRSLKITIRDMEKRLKEATSVATTVESLKRDNTKLERELRESKDREEDLMAVVADAEELRRDNEELKQELDISKSREKETRSEVAHQAGLYEVLRNDHRVLRLGNQELRSQLELYESWEDKTGDLRDQLSTERLERLEAKAQFDHFQGELLQKEQEIQELLYEREDLWRDREDLLRDQEVLLRERDEIEADLVEMKDEGNLKIDTMTKELAEQKMLFDKERQEIQDEREASELKHALELEQFSDLLEKERQARRVDRSKLEIWQKNHQHTSQTVSQKDVRIVELEGGIQSEKKKLAVVEQQYKDQLGERNNLLLALWNRLSTLCGSDWQHQNSLISGHLPTLEVVSVMLPGFSRNLLLAVKTLEGLVGGFKNRIRSIDHNFTKDLQNLEQNLDMRIKRLGRLESAVQASRNATPEVTKLKRENSMLKSDIAIMQAQERRTGNLPLPSAVDRKVSAHRATLMRHYSSSAVESLDRSSRPAGGQQVVENFDRFSSQPASGNPTILDPQNSSRPIGGHTATEHATRSSRSASATQSESVESMEARWNHRLKELEKRLKAEREGRLLDRTGARKRLEEGQAEVEELKKALARTNVKAKR